jgi:hypothetical protein
MSAWEEERERERERERHDWAKREAKVKVEREVAEDLSMKLAMRNRVRYFICLE